MILTSVTMVGWADVPDSDRVDLRRRRAVDISSYYNSLIYNGYTSAQHTQIVANTKAAVIIEREIIIR